MGQMIDVRVDHHGVWLMGYPIPFNRIQRVEVRRSWRPHQGRLVIHTDNSYVPLPMTLERALQVKAEILKAIADAGLTGLLEN